MARMVVIAERCKGCLLCSGACPRRILRQSAVVNSQGYTIVEVSDMQECTGCGACALMCPDMAIRVFRMQRGQNSHE